MMINYQVMKCYWNGIIGHFAKCIYLIENPTSKFLSPELIKLVKVHKISMIPIYWSSFVANKINGYQVQFKKDEHDLKYINHVLLKCLMINL